MNGEVLSVLNQIDIDDILDRLKPDEYSQTKDGDDIASGRLFAEVFGNVIRYNKTAKSFFYYDGKVWKIDDGDLVSIHLTKYLQKGLYPLGGYHPTRRIACAGHRQMGQLHEPRTLRPGGRKRGAPMVPLIRVHRRLGVLVPGDLLL